MENKSSISWHVGVTVWVFGVLAAFVFTNTVNAKLIDRGNGLIYDDVLNVTWTQNADLGSCTPAPGPDKWTPCATWASALVHGGFDDWRPASLDVNGDGVIVDCQLVTEAECRDNEYGYMFYYNLGGTFGNDQTGDQTTATGLTIEDIQRVYRWGHSDYFDFRMGALNQGQISSATVWVVRDGDTATPVPVDVKPSTCENPINVKSKGVFPVAIVGTENFDATTIDPDSVLLVGVPPLQSSFADVATPFEPFTGKDDSLECTLLGPDSILDLELKFDTQAIVQAIQNSLGREVVDREVIVLTLIANLFEEFGQTSVIGEDVIVLIKHGPN